MNKCIFSGQISILCLKPIAIWKTSARIKTIKMEIKQALGFAPQVLSNVKITTQFSDDMT